MSNGVLFHKPISVDHLRVGTLQAATLNLRTVDYDIELPPSPPLSTNVSLVVHSIIDRVVTLKWDLAASSSTLITAANGENVQLAVDPNLATSYALRFPNYQSNINYTGRVFAVESATADEVALKYEQFELVAEPSIAIGTSGFNFKLVAEDGLTENVDYFLPQYVAGVNYIGKVLCVSSTGGTAGDAVVNFEYSDLINAATFNVDGHTVTLADPVSVSVSTSTLAFPKIESNSDFLGAIVRCSTDNLIGDVVLQFDNQQLLIDKLVLGPTIILKPADTLNTNTLVLPPALNSVSDHTGRVLYVSSSSANTLTLSYELPGRVVSASGNSITFTAQSNSIPYDLCFPPIGTTSLLGRTLAVSSDTTGATRVLQLEYARHVYVGSDDFSSDKFTTIRTSGNAHSHTLYLPGNKIESNFGASGILGNVLGVHAHGGDSVELAFQDPWEIQNSNNFSSKLETAVTPENDYTLTLPSVDQAQNPNHYAGRVIQIISHSQAVLGTSFNTLDTFSGIAEIDLINSNGFGFSMIAPITLATYALELPVAAGAAVGNLIAVSAVSTVGGVAVSTSYDAPGVLRAANTNKKLELKAPDGITSSYDLQLPELASAVVGHTLFVGNSGNLLFGFPKSLAIQSGANTLTLLSKDVSHDVVIELPPYTQSPLNQHEGDSLFVHSQTHAAESTVHLSYTRPLKLYNTSSDGFQQVLGATHTSVTSSGTVATKFTLPAYTTTPGYLIVSDQVDYTATGDKAHVSLAFNPTTTAILADSANNTLEIDGADTFESNHELSLPVFENEAASRAARGVAELLDLRHSGVVPVRLVCEEVITGSTYSEGIGSVGDRIFVSDRLDLNYTAVRMRDVVLIAGQGNARENGVYEVTSISNNSFVLTRHPSYDTIEKVRALTLLQSQEGLKNQYAFYQLVDLFVTRGSGTVTAGPTSNVVTGINTNFTSELQLGDIIRASNGQKILVSNISSDTQFETTIAITSIVVSLSYQIGNRVGVDALRFMRVPGDCTDSHTRMHIPRTTNTPELVLGASGHETRITSSAADTRLHLSFAPIPASAHKLFLGAVSAADSLEATRAVRRVTLGGTRGRKFFRATACAGAVALQEEGIEFDSSVITAINRRLALVFDASSVTSSNTTCMELVSMAHGVGAGMATYGIQCHRTGLYDLLLNFRVQPNSTSAALTYANNFITFRLRTLDGIADSTRSQTCQARFADAELFRRGSLITKQFKFQAELTKSVTYFIEIVHTQSNTNLSNGTMRIDSSTSLLVRMIV